MLLGMLRGMKRLLTLFLLAGCLAGLAAPQDQRPPLSQDEVQDMLKNATPSKKIVATIQRYGIDFPPTAEVLQQLRNLGADKFVLDALRQGYHAEIPKPLSATQIRMLVGAETPSDNITGLVLTRGIDFQPSQAYLDEIRSMGANDALVETLRNAAPRPFSKEELLQELRTIKDQDGIAKEVRQRGVDFVAGPDNFQALRRAGAGAPLLDAVRNAHVEKPFVSKAPPAPALPPSLAGGQAVQLICGPSDSDVPVFSVPGDLGKIAIHLKCGERVTFVEKIAAPPGVDKILYGDHKEGFVAAAFLDPGIGGAGVSPPSIIYKPDPPYTSAARDRQIEGVVSLWVTIDSQGNVTEVQEKSPPLGAGLDQSAIDTVKKWKFNPAMRDGAPVAVRVIVKMTFKLG
jgi:TonB family protein